MKQAKQKGQKATGKVSDPQPEKYEPGTIEPYWQAVWEEEKIYQPDLENAKNPFYNLMMFPYPSAEGLHVGSVYAFGGADVYGRFQRMQGNDVFEPIGLDGFGIHSENHAIKTHSHPMEHARRTEANFYKQLHSFGNGFAWKNKLETYDPDYYRWTEWLFIQLFKAGLAYRKKAAVNFCPHCKTVLSDEQVVQRIRKQESGSKGKEEEISIGVCERCETPVEKRELEQWFFRITNYAERLLANIDTLDWTEKVKIAQKNWIGKKDEMEITHTVVGTTITLKTFTAYPAWSWADTFIVIAPQHPVVKALIAGTENEQSILKFIKEDQKITNSERIEDKFEKKGIFTGRYAKDPFGGPDMPIWLANFALMDFGTGSIRCSAHDPRDYEFAQKYHIPLKEVVDRIDKATPVNAHDNKGILKDSGPFSGKNVEDVIEDVKDWIEKQEIGKRVSTYHLRDWLISRQRYWGPPIPMIYCEACARRGESWFTTEEAKKYQESGSRNQELRQGKQKNGHDSLFLIPNSREMAGWYPVPEEDLPVKLPYIEDYHPLGTGKSPLASHPEFYQVQCPHCRSDARRETDVSDTFLDSSWYFLRYLATDRNDVPFPSGKFAQSQKDSGNFTGRTKWLPVNMYIGGAEHAVLHLLYSRFITMVLHDLGYLDFEEPFTRFFAHGLIIKDGAKMSKSRGNVINPDEYIRKFGADTLRCYLMFLGPFEQGGDFRDTGIEGMHRFLKRVWTLFSKCPINSDKKALDIPQEHLWVMHQTIKGVTEDLEALRYNTAIAKLMSWYNFLAKQEQVSDEETKVYLQLLAPFAPYMTEELWQKARGAWEVERKNNSTSSIHTSQWPAYDPKFLEVNVVKIAVQVNGKLRGLLRLSKEVSGDKAAVESAAKKEEKVQTFLKQGKLKNIVYVPGKVINFVVTK